MTKRLLVVDWDYFCVMHEQPREGDDGLWALYDWGHAEGSGVYLDFVWPIRAAAFAGRGLALPDTSGEEHSFWTRFTFAKHTDLYVADSNSQAAHKRVMGGTTWDEVWLYDAHHDCGYREDAMTRALEAGRVSCEDWMLAYAFQGAELHVRYPRWKDYAFDVEPTPDPRLEVDRRFSDPTNGPDGPISRVFVCRSGTWSPPWLDAKFATFVHASPAQRVVNLDEGHPLVRPWGAAEVAQVDQHVEAERRAAKMHEEANR